MARKRDAGLAELDAALKAADTPEARAERHATEAREIAENLRKWREAAGLTTSRAAVILGIPARTIEGIEQGRGFRYPRLLSLALVAFGGSG